MKHLPMSGSNKIAAFCLPKSNFESKVVGVLFVLFAFFQLNSVAQSQNQQKPGCNLTGPLKVQLNSLSRTPQSDIVVTAVASNTDPSTTFNYSFLTNTSGASIKSYGTLSYDASAKTSTQQIVVSSGAYRGGLSVQLTVTNPDGSKCSCSKSVSVIN